MLHRTLHFLRPTLIAVLLWALLAGIALLGYQLQAPREAEFNASGQLSAEDLASVDLARVTLPAADLSPEQVVRLQLTGLSDPRPDGLGIMQCYALASPANRIHTGPLDRFGRMVRQGPYQCMAGPRSMLVGAPRLDRDVARILVTIIDHDSQLRAFTFVLSRQRQPPFQDCWMTEAVLPSPPQRAFAKPSPAA